METAGPWYVQLADGRQFGPTDLATIVQWATQGRVPEDALLVSLGGEHTKSVLSEPELRRVLRAPPTVPATSHLRASAEAPGLIPYSNPKALIGYYLSVAGLIPFIGLPLAFGAIICGIIGVRAWSADRRVKGLVHAWVAILVGAFGLTESAILIVVIAMAV